MNAAAPPPTSTHSTSPSSFATASGNGDGLPPRRRIPLPHRNGSEPVPFALDDDYDFMTAEAFENLQSAANAARLNRNRRLMPILLVLVTIVPIMLLAYAGYQAKLSSQVVADVNWSASLRERSMALYNATLSNKGEAWEPKFREMISIREDLRSRYADDVARTDVAWRNFSNSLINDKKVSWETANAMHNASDSLTFDLEQNQRTQSNYVLLLFSMGILSLTVSLPWGLSMFKQLQKAEGQAIEQNVQLTEATKRFASLFNGVPVACFAFDGYGRIKDWNRACEAMYGVPAATVLDKPVWAVTVRDKEQAEAEARMRNVCETGTSFENIEWAYVRPDGETRTILCSAFPLLAKDKTAGNGGIGAGVDITARKISELQLMRLTEELKQSNRELQEFAFVASHDLKEPLRKIQTFGGILQRKAASELSPDNSEYLNRILSAARRMQALIDDILALARITMKGKPFERVDLNGLVGGVAQDLELAAERVNGKVVIESLPPLIADPSQIRQLFQNLISNALKFHNPGVPSVVTITGAIEPAPNGVESTQAVHLTVADNGVGFGPEYAEKIFEMFEQVDDRRRAEGTGMGLAICRKIAERHGGTMNATGVPGEGATFHIYLPVRPDAG